MITLVGECPGRESIASRPSLALTGSSGRNLCRIAGWDWFAYLKRTARYNLFLDPQPKWDAREAERRASRMHELMADMRVVLCGARVARAFHVEDYPLYQWHTGGTGTPIIAIIPHPSGRNRVWNDSRELVRARAFLEGLL